MVWRSLDKVDSSIYKGLAILLIVMHNFMHLFPKPKENEFEFQSVRVLDFIHLAISEPENLARLTLAFLGHYGVQVFIFLSAYGLTKKYLQEKPMYSQFLWQRLAKLYPAFILAIVTWLLVEGWVLGDYGLLGPIKVLYWNIVPLLLKLTLLSNFVPDYSLQPMGPWWFIPFIFQFYLVFPLLRHLHVRFGTTGLLVVSIASVVFAMFSGGKIGELNIYFTVVGHLPEICLGIYLASNRQSTMAVSNWWIVFALFIFVLGNFYETFWYFSHITVLIILLAGFTAMASRIRQLGLTKRLVLFFGEISMMLFLVNGFLREPYIGWAMFHDHWLLTIALCLVSLATSTLLAYLLTVTLSRGLASTFPKFPAFLARDLKKV